MTDLFQRVPNDLLRHLFEEYVGEPFALVPLQFVNKRFKQLVERALERERQRTIMNWDK